MSNNCDRDMGRQEGERRRDEAHDLLATYRGRWIRWIQREFLLALLDRGEATTDVLGDEIPDDIRERTLGGAILGLSGAKLIRKVRYVQSTRASRHANDLKVWTLLDRDVAIRWLDAHPDPGDDHHALLDPSDAAPMRQGLLFAADRPQETATPADRAGAA